MAEGHDGFAALSGHKYLIDHEGGTLMSTIVRKYLLGESLVPAVEASQVERW